MTRRGYCRRRWKIWFRPGIQRGWYENSSMLWIWKNWDSERR